MKNPLKKINFKSKSKELGELLDSMTEIINDLVQDGLKLQEEKKKLGLRCQSLEVTVREQNRKIKKLEEVAFQNKQKAVKLQQELHEANYKAAMYSDFAIKFSKENTELKQRLAPAYEPDIQKKEVSESGAVGSM